jgi:ArsR family transcriptional regulator
MKALSDPNRVKILKMLQRKELCVCEIRAALEITQPTVSSHLKALENADLVRSRKEGLWVIYSLADGKSNPYCATLLGNLMHWLENDPGIERIVEVLQSIQRENVCKK